MTTTTATRTNTYAGTCASCGTHVAAAAGVLGGKVNGRWTVRHNDCGTATAPAPRRQSQTSRPATHRCEQCGAARAHYARDMSGIGGYACYRCDDGSLSFM